MSKIIIAGSAGFIGSNLCSWLLENTDHEIVGVDNFSSGFRENLPQHERFTNWYVNITDRQELNRVFNREEPDICYLLAAYAAEGRSNYIRNFIHSNNTIGAANVINACVNYDCKLIFTSSVAVYSGAPPYSEETVPNPIDEYGLSKWTTEKSIQIAGEQQGLDWCIIRPRNCYGERQSMFDSARNVFGIWMYQILNNEPMTMFGDGSNKRTFTYIGDILRPLYNAIKVEKQIINLGAYTSYTIKEANEILQGITEYAKMDYLEARHEVPMAYCLTEKSKELLGFCQETGIYHGLKKMWEWAKTVKMRERIVPPKLEVHKNIHSSII